MGFKEIGRKIQAAREERGMTQVDLSQVLGITQAALSNYELGKRRLYLNQIEQIAGVLGKTLDYFIEEANPSAHQTGTDDRAETLETLGCRLSALSPQELSAVHEFLDFLEWRRRHVPCK